ncbi:MFS transporter [Arthrobacter sp. RIT-PI-e]|uniref:MFS transporter n=1 Tax=Arthrobacter sp. RIT-PI-e TaxID=1681197 RepID=UPI0006762AA0|nr:MFS transporter [Arthrobacter sp. RIT-PI-e]KNC18553.1 MFS transporter [Arthrobacter sp. RIT-PI-e]
MSVIDEIRMRPAPVAPRSWDASLAVRLALAVTVISTLLVGANLATPIYPLIQVDLELSPFAVTVAFASYVVALIGGLLLAGHWSDHIGRRAALVLAVLAGLAGTTCFAPAPSLPVRAAGRTRRGAAAALAPGAGAAAPRALLPPRPEWASRFPLRASAGGVAAGPVIGGLLSLLPNPTRTPFLVYLVVLAALLVPLVLLRARPAPTPAPPPNPPPVPRPRRPAVPRAARSSFRMAATVGFLSFAVFGFTLSLAPTWFAGIAGTTSRPLVGVLAALVLGSSAASQLLSPRGRFGAPAGRAGVAPGVGLLPLAEVTASLPLLVVACLLAGAGQGMAFRVVFNEVSLKVAPALHAQTVSAVYVITYLGSAVPVLGLGAAAGIWGLDTSVTVFALLVSAACAALAVGSLVQRSRRRTR